MPPGDDELRRAKRTAEVLPARELLHRRAGRACRGRGLLSGGGDWDSRFFDTGENDVGGNDIRHAEYHDSKLDDITRLDHQHRLEPQPRDLGDDVNADLSLVLGYSNLL
ncbi:hypothetical protein CDD80_5150 [Ophiocordyceps camponoti-rufipedis]|uniref:Uncharacterized protein n=1 Tax=Ophiocordyceps camponoti-rufipedis TaxID=2004952 RepID=A0A2C5ZMB3_9HYPO|nr:hypothetical protein CDD80_5150 [Ophiocordyceps camponoti-rufipedis]